MILFEVSRCLVCRKERSCSRRCCSSYYTAGFLDGMSRSVEVPCSTVVPVSAELLTIG